MPPDVSTTDAPSWRASLATMLERLRRGDSGQLLRAALPPLLPALAVLLVLPLAPGPWLLRGALALFAAIGVALVIAAAEPARAAAARALARRPQRRW